jgi:hypothetical protein
MITARARDRIIQSIEYHENMARYLGGEDHVERFHERRRREREAREADESRSQPEEAQGQESRTSQEPGDSGLPHREDSDDARQAAAPEEDKRSPEEVAADNHADAARQLRELLASQPAEPAINVARRDHAAAGLMSRLGIRRRYNA